VHQFNICNVKAYRPFFIFCKISTKRRKTIVNL